MPLGIDPETGKFGWLPDEYNAPEVPGANQTQFYGEDPNQDKISGAMAQFQTENTKQDGVDQTEAQKAAEKAEKAKTDLAKADLEAKKAQITLADAAQSPELQDNSEQAQVTRLGEDLLANAPENPNAQIAGSEIDFTGASDLLPEDQPLPPEQPALAAVSAGAQPEAVQPTGSVSAEVDAIEGQKIAAAQEAGVDIGRTKELLAESRAVETTVGNMQAEEQRRTEREFKERQDARNDLLGRFDAAVKAKPKPPSPSVANLIGVFLGGLIAPMNGGRNVAADLLMRKLQSETDAQMETRRADLAGLRAQQGVLADDETAARQHNAERAGALSQRIQGTINAMKLKVEENWVDPAKRAELRGTIAQLEREQGKLLDGVAKEFDERVEREAALQARLAASAAKKGGGGSGGGGGRGSAEKGVVSAAKNSPLYFDAATGSVVDFNQLDKKSQKDARSELAQVPIVDKETGTVLRGIRGLSDKQADRIQKAWGDRNKVTAGTSRILELLSQVKDSDRLVIGGASKTEQGAQLQAEFTQLMVALKDQWELGAIQKPDEKLLEGAMGARPTDAFAYLATRLNVNQIESVMQNLQSGGNLRMNNSILSEAGLPDNFEIPLPKFDSKSDIVERGKKVAANTAPVQVEQLGLLLGENSYGPGKRKADPAEISAHLDTLEEMAKLGKGKTSATAGAGGEAIDGPTISKLRSLRAKATNPGNKAQIDRILDSVGNAPAGWSAAKKKLDKKYSAPGSNIQVPGLHGTSVGDVLRGAAGLAGLGPTANPVIRNAVSKGEESKARAYAKKRAELRELEDLSRRRKRK